MSHSSTLQELPSYKLLFPPRYTEAPPEQKPFREKDGALLAIGALADRLKQQEPYKSALEQMLLEHVLPDFQNSHGHLRAKVRTYVASI